MDKETIFKNIREILRRYKSFTAIVDTDTDYDLYTNKPIEVFGRKYPRMYFAATKIKKNFVGFYYMPIYMNPEAIKSIKPELLKCLKGKTCFNITKDDPVLYRQIDELLQIGEKAYRERGWL